MGVVILSTVAAPVHAASGRPVSFRTDDGRVVNALLFEADQRPAPAVVLVPMLGKSREDWQTTGQRLSEANITALAIDLPSTTLPDDPKALSGWAHDVTAAVVFLASRPEVRPDAIGIAGASLGANLAAVAAASYSRVRSLALVSPSLDYRGVRIEAAMRQYGARPALLIASNHDPYAARTVRDLAKDPPGVRETQWSEATAHGTVLLAEDGELVRRLVEWFQRTL